MLKFKRKMDELITNRSDKLNKFNILTINPGSTSTKISIFDTEGKEIKEELHHDIKDLQGRSEEEEILYRLELIEKILREKNIDLKNFNGIVGRGGLLRPLESGTYSINEKMIEDLKSGKYGKHASNFGGILAKKIGDKLNIPSFIVDPVVVDEMDDIAKISGIPEIPRKSIFHALNQKSVSRRFCDENSLDYKKISLIVVHMGGGVSVGIHHNGRVIDVNNALDGDGPFSPERSGGVPIGDFFRKYYEGLLDKEFLLKRIKGNGGVVGYLGTNNVKEIVENIEKGDSESKEIIDAMCYQISKEIGALSTVLNGKIDGIILTGGMAYSKYIVNKIEKRVSFISKVTTIPGENEMLSLYMGGCRVLGKNEDIKEY